MKTPKQSEITKDYLRRVFSTNLKRFRKDCNLTITELSELCNLTPSIITKYETEQASPRDMALSALCRALKRTPKEFYYEEYMVEVMNEVCEKVNKELVYLGSLFTRSTKKIAEERRAKEEARRAAAQKAQVDVDSPEYSASSAE